MPRLMPLVVAVSLTCAATAAADQPVGGARVSGRVTAAATGTPIAGASVTVSVEGQRRFADADARGEFGIDLPAAGLVWIRVEHPGFLETFWPDAVGGADVPGNEVTPGGVLSGIELRLERGGAIDGVVIDENGVPVAGQLVAAVPARDAVVAAFRGAYSSSPRPASFLDADPSSSTVSALTDDRGYFRLHTLVDDTYLVGVTRPEPPAARTTPGHRVMPSAPIVWAPGTRRPGSAATFVVSRGVEHGGVTIRMAHQPTTTIAGQVVDDEGAPCAAVLVMATSDASAEDDVPEAAAFTDEGGRFRIANVVAGRWRLEAVQMPSHGEVGERRRATLIVDAAPSAPPVRIQLQRRPSIRGRLTIRDDPAARVPAEVFVVSQRLREVWDILRVVAAAPVQPDGTFVVTPMTDEVELGLMLPDDAGLRLEHVLVDGRDRLGASLAADELARADVELVVTSTGTVLVGRVRSDAMPRERCDVLVVSTDPARRNLASPFVATGDCSGGSYGVGPLPPGDYRVAAIYSSTGPDGLWQRIEDTATSGVPITLSGDGVRMLDLTAVVRR